MALNRSIVLTVALVALLCCSAAEAKKDVKRDKSAPCTEWRCDTDYGFWSKTAMRNDDGDCECMPYYTEGPCEGLKCPEGWMAKPTEGKEDSDCSCVDPCAGLHCDPPKVEVPDYGRTTDSWCKCVDPPSGYEKDEL